MRLRGIQIGLQLFYGRDMTRLPESWLDGMAPVLLSDETATGVRESAERVREIFEREFPFSRG